jgi:hypothetical protein
VWLPAHPADFMRLRMLHWLDPRGIKNRQLITYVWNAAGDAVKRHEPAQHLVEVRYGLACQDRGRKAPP